MKIVHYPFPPPGEAPVVEQRKPYPAPALTSAMPACDVVPGPVMLLKWHAECLGWICLSPRQSIGHVPHASHGTPSEKAKTLWSLRMMRGDRRAVAVRTDGSWSSLWTWSTTEFFSRHATLEAFREGLR